MNGQIALSSRREQLYEVAARLFAEQGYKATSMRDIAGALGLKAGSLYSHISSKEELLWTIISRIADEFDRALEPARNPQLPPAERLRLALEAYVGVVTRHHEFASVLFGEWRQLPGEQQGQVAARRDAVEGVFRAILKAGIQQGDFAPDTDVQLAAILALSGANNLPGWFQPGGRLSAQQVADGFVALLLRGCLIR